MEGARLRASEHGHSNDTAMHGSEEERETCEFTSRLRLLRFSHIEAHVQARGWPWGLQLCLHRRVADPEGLGPAWLHLAG